MKPEELLSARLIHLHHLPLQGWSLEGLWTDFKRDLSQVGLTEVDPREGRDLEVVFPVQAIYVNEAGVRWLVVQNQDLAPVLLHESLPTGPFKKGDPIWWDGAVPVPGEVLADESTPTPNTMIHVRLQMGGPPSDVVLSPKELKLRNIYTRLKAAPTASS